MGPFIRHHHDHDDELFLVIHGSLRIEFRDRDVWVEEGEFLIVARGVEHRPLPMKRRTSCCSNGQAR